MPRLVSRALVACPHRRSVRPLRYRTLVLFFSDVP
jgi:hypothetical protein